MKKYLFFAAALFTLAACNNDDNLPTDDPNAPVEIRLSSGIQVQTRATHNLDENLKVGETVHVWVDDTGNDVMSFILYENNILTVDADQTTLSDGATMYFPSTGNTVNIYAIHGNIADASFDNFWGGTSITHSVLQDQQSRVIEAGKGYAGSDLVYCKLESVNRTKNTVNLEFEHLLSKVEVVLVQGAGSPTISKVEILNTKLKAQFTPSKTEDWAVTAAEDIDENGNPITIDNGTTDAEIAKKTDNDEGKTLNEAIIVPQTLDKNTGFIRITTNKGGVLVYALDESTKFEPGMKYRYIITANLTGLQVTASIAKWGDGDEGQPTEGEAEMQPDSH